MNEPIKMYRTKQIIHHNISVQLPKCMYNLKNIHSRSSNGVVDGSHDHVGVPNNKVDIFDQNNQNIPGMAELEAKQEEILKQLEELKNQILSIKLSLKSSNASVKPSIPQLTIPGKHTSKKTKQLVDLVVNASPTNPPYSLEVIQKQFLRENVNLKFSAHVHSSVPSLTEEATNLQNRLVNSDSISGAPTVNLRLIWKNVGYNLELLVSHTPIVGEVNLIRYLVRAAVSLLDYEADTDSIEIDSLLDICHLIVRSKTKTERTSLFQSLNKSMGKSQWLCGRSQASVVDIAAYSAIKQTTSMKELGANLSKWFQRCETIN